MKPVFLFCLCLVGCILSNPRCDCATTGESIDLALSQASEDSNEFEVVDPNDESFGRAEKEDDGFVMLEEDVSLGNASPKSSQKPKVVEAQQDSDEESSVANKNDEVGADKVGEPLVVGDESDVNTGERDDAGVEEEEQTFLKEQRRELNERARSHWQTLRKKRMTREFNTLLASLRAQQQESQLQIRQEQELEEEQEPPSLSTASEEEQTQADEREPSSPSTDPTALATEEESSQPSSLSLAVRRPHPLTVLPSLSSSSLVKASTPAALWWRAQHRARRLGLIEPHSPFSVLRWAAHSTVPRSIEDPLGNNLRFLCMISRIPSRDPLLRARMRGALERLSPVRPSGSLAPPSLKRPALLEPPRQPPKDDRSEASDPSALD